MTPTQLRMRSQIGEDVILDIPVRRPSSVQRLCRDLDNTIDCVQTVQENVNKLIHVVLDLHAKIDEIMNNQSKRSAGCGLSCSNNSFPL